MNLVLITFGMNGGSYIGGQRTSDLSFFVHDSFLIHVYASYSVIKDFFFSKFQIVLFILITKMISYFFLNI